jgi:folate-binding protein YgfZ
MISVTGYRAARDHAAIVDRRDRARIVVSGHDRASYLQGLLTNDIEALKPGEGCYAAYLTPQGRMISDVHVYELGDVMLLALPAQTKDVVLTKLDQFIFSEDVQLGDVTQTFFDLAVVGPDAGRVLGSVLGEGESAGFESMPEHGNRRLQFGGQPAIVARITDLGEPGFDVFVQKEQAGELEQALDGAGVARLDEGLVEAIRIEAGVPKFGRDLDEDTIPLEAGLESRAISFSKGCYVGQEVIIRVLHRGHGRVARRLSGVIFEGDRSPAAGAAVIADGREIGRVTSSAISPALRRPIALAYLHRDSWAAGTSLTADGITGTVADLPFVKRL